MQQIRCPERVRRPVGNIITHTTHRVQPSSNLIAQITDDRLLGCVRATPVTSPACTGKHCCGTRTGLLRTFLITVAIGVVTTKQDILLVTIDHNVKRSNGRVGWVVAKVLAVQC
jgi:hypothetical protein